MTSSSSSKRKQEEKLTQVLRELAGQAFNKQCFDCNQRGPTYVDMTIGSFVCTSCSGILRGLNPPHRVKSISMATFTTDEIDFIKSRGNEYCRKIWLGLYDGDPSAATGGFKDENQIKDLLIQKYEKKRWYVSPSEIARQQQYFEQAARRTVFAGSNAASSAFGVEQTQQDSHVNSIPPVASQSKASTAINRPIPSQQGAVPNSLSLIDPALPPALPKSFTSPGADIFNNSFSSGASAGSGTSTNQARVQSTQQQTAPNNFSTDNFADFDSAFNGSSPPTALAAPVLPSSDLFANVPKSQTVPVSLGSTTLRPLHLTQNPVSNGHGTHHDTVNAAPVSSVFSADKYSALADLDEVFRSSDTTATVAAPAVTQLSDPQQQSHPMLVGATGIPNSFVSSQSVINKAPVAAFGPPSSVAAFPQQIPGQINTNQGWAVSRQTAPVGYGVPMPNPGFQTSPNNFGPSPFGIANSANVFGTPSVASQMFHQQGGGVPFQTQAMHAQQWHVPGQTMSQQAFNMQQHPVSAGIPMNGAAVQQTPFGLMQGDSTRKWNPFL